MGKGCTNLRGSNDIALRLDRPRAEERLPVGLAGGDGEGGGEGNEVGSEAAEGEAYFGEAELCGLGLGEHTHTRMGREGWSWAVGSGSMEAWTYIEADGGTNLAYGSLERRENFHAPFNRTNNNTQSISHDQ